MGYVAMILTNDNHIEQLKAQLAFERTMHEKYKARQAQGVQVVNSFKGYDFAYAKPTKMKIVKAS